jgi:LEA14-like dessication related protein
MVHCPNCGSENDEDNNYCIECGEQLPDDTKDEEEKSETSKEEKEGHQTTEDDKTENDSEETKENSSSRSLFSSKRLIASMLIILFLGFTVPKLPALMAASGIQEAPGVEPLRVETTSLKIASLEEGLVLDMVVHNPNSFSADLGRVTYDVHVAGEHVGSGEKNTYESIAGGSAASIESDINMDLSGSLGAVGGVIGDRLTGEKSYVHVEGDWHYKVGPASFSIPFEERSEI